MKFPRIFFLDPKPLWNNIKTDSQLYEFTYQKWFQRDERVFAGVMTAVDAVVEHLKGMSKQVTTPEEIAQASIAQFLYVWYLC